MALHICNCFALSNHNLHNKQSHSPLFSNSMPKASSLLQRHTSTVPPPPPTLTSPLFTKRKLSLSILAAAVFLNGFFPNLPKPIFAQELELERYTDSKEGFTLLRPSSWIKVFPFLQYLLLCLCCVNEYGWLWWMCRLIKQGPLFCLKMQVMGATMLALW